MFQASSDEELNEKEVRRLQRAQAAKLAAADFGLEEDEDEDEGEGDSEEDEDEDLDEEGQATMGALADGRKAGKQQQQQEGGKKGKKDGSKGKEGRGQQGAGVEVEAVARDLGALGDQDRMAALLADAPELLSLLQDLQDGLAEVGGESRGCGGLAETGSDCVGHLLELSERKETAKQGVCTVAFHGDGVSRCVPALQAVGGGARLRGLGMYCCLMGVMRRRALCCRCGTAWARCCRSCVTAGWAPRRACRTWRPSTCCCCRTASTSCSTCCSRRRGGRCGTTPSSPGGDREGPREGQVSGSTRIRGALGGTDRLRQHTKLVCTCAPRVAAGEERRCRGSGARGRGRGGAGAPMKRGF